MKQMSKLQVKLNLTAVKLVNKVAITLTLSFTNCSCKLTLNVLKYQLKTSFAMKINKNNLH